jgi:murein DD-endopeptidase MepM/ murein hydrolase activator NlpD
VGATSQFTATAILPGGGSQDITQYTTWSTSSDYVATVSSAGLVSALSVGDVDVIGTYKAVTGRQRATTQRVPPCGVTPAASNRVIPVFASPVRGTFRIINYFDHDAGTGWADGNGFQLNSCGDKDSRKTDGHNGIDYATPVGTPLYAAADGEVIYAGLNRPFACPPLGGIQTQTPLIRIRHPVVSGERFNSEYYHMSRIDVRVGESVRLGQQIGLTGDIGCIIGAAVHFSVQRLLNGNPNTPRLIDPYGWEGPGSDPWASHPDGAGSFWLWLAGQAPQIN